MIKSILLLLITCFLLSGCSHETNNIDNNNNEPEVNRTATDTNVTSDSFPEVVAPEENTVKEPSVEQELSSFTTKIYTKDSERQNNLRLTCSTLNGTTVANEETFSFTKTLGPSTSAKGYQEADIFDSKGNKKKGLGGGNCQVSSTLYNAVLAVPTLSVMERHEHSNKVPYVKQGKDAAVAYGSVDFKFKNNTGSTIKIYAEATTDEVIIRIVKI